MRRVASHNKGHHEFYTMIQTDLHEKTSITLMGAIRTTSDQASWMSFVATYEPMLKQWLRADGVPVHVIPDVISDVYLKLVNHLPDFVYDKRRSFRGWLRTIAQHAAVDMQKRAHQRYEVVVDFHDPNESFRFSDRMRRSQNEGLDQFVESMNDRMSLANQVVKRVRARIDKKTWKAFYLTEVVGHTCEYAALKLKMKEGSVYVARFRVRNYLQKEAESLTSDGMPK